MTDTIDSNSSVLDASGQFDPTRVKRVVQELLKNQPSFFTPFKSGKDVRLTFSIGCH
jgi:hypothetical protein